MKRAIAKKRVLKAMNPRLAVVRAMTLTLLMSVVTGPIWAWEIDLTRRQKKVRNSEEKAGTNTQQNADVGFLGDLFDVGKPHSEVVILNTDKGFIPQTVRLKKGTKYTFFIVNVNEAEKNVSFVMDSFSEHHGTYYGKIKSFDVTPQKEGVFSYQCPETSIEGRVVVYNGNAPGRALSSAPDEK